MHALRISGSATCLAALALLTGCKPVGQNYNRPGFSAPPAYKETGASTVLPPPKPENGDWKVANPSDGMLKGKWWEIYHDPQLNQLEERIATNNAQLRQAMETYLAARNQVNVARSNLYPTLSAGPSVSRNKLSANRALAPAGSETDYEDFSIAGQASWELDFWGRIRRTIEQSRANVQATAAQVANVDLALHAELATDYFALRGIDSQIKLLTATVASLEHQMELTQRRFAGGVSTAVDVAQAKTQLETVRAQLVDLNVSRSHYEHAIGTLANYNLSEFNIPSSPLDQALPQIPTGVPSQLLERRPDIAVAERTMAAANEQIGIAMSAYYPTIRLTGTGGFDTGNPGTWIQGPSSLWSLGAQATQLLFDAGRRHALTDAARHSYDAQTAAYRNSIFQAFYDVEDQMAALRVLEQEARVEQVAVDSAEHSLDLSNQRYKGGVTAYLEVLNAEQALISNQRTAIGIQSRQFAASVSLIRALGGGWDVTQLPK